MTHKAPVYYIELQKVGVQFLLVYLSKKVASLAILHWNCSFSKIIGCIRGRSQRMSKPRGGDLENQDKLGHRGEGFFSNLDVRI